MLARNPVTIYVQSNLHPMLNVAIKAARAAGAIINRAALDVESVRISAKADQRLSLPKSTTLPSEQAVIETLLTAYPGHGILAEESGSEHGAKELRIRLDHRSAGRHHQLHPRLSRLLRQHCPGSSRARSNRPWFTTLRATTSSAATKGRGAYMNDRRIRVSKRTQPPGMPDFDGFPVTVRVTNFKNLPGNMLGEVMQRSVPVCAAPARPRLTWPTWPQATATASFETGLSTLGRRSRIPAGDRSRRPDWQFHR
jgi:myo-inositol-1(or 4)-monophosphatase